MQVPPLGAWIIPRADFSGCMQSDGIRFVRDHMPKYRFKSAQFNRSASLIGFAGWAMVSAGLDAAEREANLFPVDDFPFSFWELPPLDPAVPVPAGFPPHYPIASLLELADRKRLLAFHEDANSVTLTATLDENLDLAAELTRARGNHAKAPVPLGPRMVVGQGADEGNLTFVKILNAHGIADIQFLSHPPQVRGGVNVAAARTGKGAFRIAAAPISDASVTVIPLFNEHGGKVGEFKLPLGMGAPVWVVAGDFLSEAPGDEFIVTPRSEAGPAVILSAEGEEIQRLGPLLAGKRQGEIRIEPIPNESGGHDLLATSGNQWQRLAFEGRKSIAFEAKADLQATGVFPSVFSSNRLLIAMEDPLRSIWLETEDGIDFEKRDVGAFENRFWYDLAMNHGGARADWKSPPEGKYVRSATYAHLRVEGSSPRAKEPASLEAAPLWTAGEAEAFGQRIFARFDKPLHQQPLKIWEPTFTHRMSSWFKPWLETKDPRTGLSRYGALDRDGYTDDYEEGVGTKKSSFLISTYAYGLPALDSLFNQSLRGFLNRLSPRFREHPEMVFSMEPNHEHEINIGRKKSAGDYNPKMVEGFFLHLVGLYGGNLAHLNEVMGTPFTTHFDAPRNLGRGGWDEMKEGNPFYDAWYFYNRHVINRRIANTFRESLLAGFPPEVIKSHQIPDSYAVASTKEFSSTQARITPVDYALSAGVGFGFTRYGVWYNKGDMMAGASSSGFDSVILGEYNALSAEVKPAVDQLKYIFENGGLGVHCMYWPTAWNPKSPEFNRSMEAAVHELRKAERPRPGYAGGIGRVVPFRDGSRVMNIASLGTGGKHTGLIKSLREDGTWEGSVYAVPFRTAIRVDEVATRNEAGRISSVPVDGLEGGDQLEIHFRASSATADRLHFKVTHLGVTLPGLSRDLAVSPKSKNYRIVLRSPLPASGIVVSLEHHGRVNLGDLKVLRQTAEIARLHRGKMTGIRNRGGVTFDLLD